MPAEEVVEVVECARGRHLSVGYLCWRRYVVCLLWRVWSICREAFGVPVVRRLKCLWSAEFVVCLRKAKFVVLPVEVVLKKLPTKGIAKEVCLLKRSLKESVC